MKTAVSIPDPVFSKAEVLAKRLGISRSELYSRAVDQFVEEHKHDNVREALDAIYATPDSALDPIVAQLQWESLPADDW